MDRFAVIHIEAFAGGEFEAAGIEAELVQDGGMDVGDVMAIFNGVEAEFVGDAVLHAAFDSGARQPCAEALRMMIPARSFRGPF